MSDRRELTIEGLARLFPSHLYSDGRVYEKERRAARAVLVAIADAADDYENEHLDPCEFDALYAFAAELRRIAEEPRT